LILLTEISVIFIAILLIWHSLKYLGKELSVLFWVSAGILGFFREWLVSTYLPLYTYGEFTIVVDSIPIIMFVFWSSFFYVSMVWTENILGTKMLHWKNEKQQAYQYLFVVMMSISFLIETFASQFGMVHWNETPLFKLWGGTPVIAPFGYGILALAFLITFRSVNNNNNRPLSTKMAILLLSSPLIIIVQLGLLFLIKSSLSFLS
jgi:hypothetical protein